MSARTSTRRKAGRPSNPIPRERLLALARAAFARVGFGGATMTGIAADAGIRRSSLFHHFGSKDALYYEAVGGVLGDMVQVIAAAMGHEGTFEQRIGRLVDGAVTYFGAAPDVAPLIMREVLGDGPFMQGDAGAQAAQAVLEAVAGLLDAAVAAGEIPEADTKQLAVSIVGVHLFYFAGPVPVGRFLGGDALTDDLLARRTAAVQRQIVDLCGAG